MFTHVAGARTGAPSRRSTRIGSGRTASDPMTEPLKIEAGLLQVPQRPGLGIEIDLMQVEKAPRPLQRSVRSLRATTRRRCSTWCRLEVQVPKRPLSGRRTRLAAGPQRPSYFRAWSSIWMPCGRRCGTVGRDGPSWSKKPHRPRHPLVAQRVISALRAAIRNGRFMRCVP